MTDLTLTPAIYQLDLRNRAAEKVIASVALKHAVFDAVVGTASARSQIAGDLVAEGGVGAVVAAIPFLGVLTSGALDAALAATMTWRVGAVVLAYFQNGGYVGLRKATYDLVKQHGVSFSTDCERDSPLTPSAARSRSFATTGPTYHRTDAAECGAAKSRDRRDGERGI